MQISKENYELRRDIQRFEKRIEEMHQDFYKYYNGIEKVLPPWESLERELLLYSKKKIFDRQLASNFDRILYKFQNRKKIWLHWVDEYHHRRDKEEEEAEEESEDTEEDRG
ncbi:hypothetical protein ACFL6W_00195 [Thermodesulfobacteriota bacterium]